MDVSNCLREDWGFGEKTRVLGREKGGSSPKHKALTPSFILSLDWRCFGLGGDRR